MIVELFNRESESQLPICPKLILHWEIFRTKCIVSTKPIHTIPAFSKKKSILKTQIFISNFTPRTHDNPITTDNQRSLGEIQYTKVK